MSEVKKQIPNMLTLIRIPMAILCAYFAISLNSWSLSFSLSLFILASATDFLDGYLARKWNIVSAFGKIFDPIADKILILGVLFVFTYNGIIPLLLTIIITFREIALTVIRLLLLSKKVVLASRFSGKVKTFSQSIALVIIYLLLIFINPLTQVIGLQIISYTILLLLLWIMSITLYSGIEILVYNIKAIRQLA
ncbi:MAG: CDP-diacylglycerol--glycerol-3-phosphate 3-phosphatidyltransferase [Bacteroidota bacterium]